MVESDPGLVRRFVTASLKGWEYALEQPEEIADRIARAADRAAKYLICSNFRCRVGAGQRVAAGSSGR